MALTVEEAGILSAFVTSCQSTQGALFEQHRHLLDKANHVLKNWQGARAEGKTQGEPERRTQLTLRAAIDKFEQRRYEDITADDLGLVRGTLDGLRGRAEPDERATRLIGLLERLLEDFGEHVDYEPAPDPGGALPVDMLDTAAPVAGHEGRAAGESDEPAGMHHLVAGQFFEPKPRKRIKTLAGIQVDLTVRSYEVRGNVNMEGDLPEDVLLVVRDGAIAIDGYVYGSLLATDDVTVHKNVQGAWVISSKGDIKVGGALAGATLIAQVGRIACDRAESPRQLFGRYGLTIAGDVQGGRLFGRSIHIGGTAAASEMHAVGPITVGAIEAGPRAETLVCLRKTLTSEDYGRPLDAEATSLRRTMIRDERHLPLLENRERHAQADILNCYRSMLYYMFIGSTEQSRLYQVRAEQTRLICVQQVLETAKGLQLILNAAIETGFVRHASTLEVAVEETLETLRTVSESTQAGVPESTKYYASKLASDTREFTGVVNQIKKALAAQRLDKKHAIPFTRCLEAWRAQQEASTRELESLVNQLRLRGELVTKIETEPGKLEAMLDTVVTDAHNKPKSEMARRAGSAFMQMMRRTIERHEKDIRRWRRERQIVENRLRETYQSLERDPSIILPDRYDPQIFVEAKRFDEGVIISSIPGFTQSSDMNDGPVLRLIDSVPTTARYTLRDNVIRRE